MNLSDFRGGQRHAIRAAARRSAIALAVSVVLQYLIVPPFAYRIVGWETIRLCLILDSLIGLRLLLAYVLGQKGYGWRFYEFLCYSSPAWIVLVVKVRLHLMS